MNDINFLELVNTIRQGLLYLFNSSLFWIFTGLYFIVNTLSYISRSLCECDEHEPKKPEKRWCYDE